MNRDFAKIIGAKSYQYWGLESTNMGKKLSLFELIKFTLKKNPVPKGGIIISKQCSDYFTRLIMEMKLYIFNTKKENKNSLRKHHYINKSLSIQCMDFKNTDRKSLDKTPVGGGGN